MTTRLPEKLTTLPDVPKEFGDDGGKFYRYYDELADELDEDLVKSLKAQLDGILIFAGLFAGVNSAFLAFTLPQMSADPADDTNALLLQILLAGNSSITSAADLPSASFTPPPRIYPINVLFSVSLSLALISSFLAVLGQQWIVYYHKRSGGGPEHQRWEQLCRSLGAKRWRLELVLDDLVPGIVARIFYDFEVSVVNRLREFLADIPEAYGLAYKNVMAAAVRQADDPEYLKGEAIRRVICISEDRAALVHAAMNLQTIRNHGFLSSLLEDEGFSNRIFELHETRSYQVRSQRPHNTDLIEARAFCTSFFHIWLSAGSISDIENLLGWNGSDPKPAKVFKAIRSRCEGALVPLTADCDRCVHCTTLSFSIRVVSLLVDDGQTWSLSFDDVFNEVEGALTKSVDLNLGCVVAAAVLCSKMSGGPYLTGRRLEETTFKRASEQFKELAMAYRARDNSQMIEVVGRGLATVESKWNGQPNHELYIRLFELGFSSGIGISGARPILEQLGTLLLAIENRIRDQATSDRDGQRGREHQNRCVQSVAENFKQQGHSDLEIWLHIGPSVESYLKGVKTLVETDPANPNNPPTIGLLRRIKSSFPGPASVGRLPDRMYREFCELLDQIETVCQTRNTAISEDGVMQLTGVLSDDTDAIESTGTRNTDKKDVFLHASPSLWGN